MDFHIYDRTTRTSVNSLFFISHLRQRQSIFDPFVHMGAKLRNTENLPDRYGETTVIVPKPSDLLVITYTIWHWFPKALQYRQKILKLSKNKTKHNLWPEKGDCFRSFLQSILNVFMESSYPYIPWLVILSQSTGFNSLTFCVDMWLKCLNF